MKKSFRKPRRIKKKKSIFRNRFFWLAILVLVLAGGISYLFSFSDFFQIKEIKIAGTQKLDAEGIRGLIEENIREKFLFFYTKSIFLVDKKEIISRLSKNFSRIDEITLKKKYPDGLILQIKEREAIGCFCQNTACFLLDKKGIIFEETGEGCSLDLIIRDFRNIAPTSLGKKALEEPLLDSINKIREKIKESLQVNISEFNVTETQDRKLAAKTITGWEIYFNPMGDIDWQLTKLVQVINKEIPPEKRENLEYIDVRFGNFAPYKYRR